MIFRQQACIVVLPAYRAAVNWYFERNGYGPNNVAIPLIATNDPDNAEPKAWAAEALVDSGIMAILNLAKSMDGFWYATGPAGETLLPAFAETHGFRIKPAIAL